MSALAVAGVWLSARGNLRAARAADYRALLGVEADLVARWLDERSADARQLGADPVIVAMAERVAALGVASCRDQRQTGAVLASTLRQRFGAAAPPAAHILASDGTVLVSLFGGYCGKRLTPQVVERLTQGKRGAAVFIAPIVEAERIKDAPAAERKPMVWFEAGLRAADGAATGFVGYGLDAERYFDALFAEHSRRGLRRLFAVDTGSGRDMSGRADTPLAAAILSSARDGVARGELMDPYPNARGRQVVGAWRRLPDSDIAVALEVDAAETYRTLTAMRWTAVLLAASAAASALASAQLRRREFAADGSRRRVGPYRILSLLGEGALSNVYLAEHRLMRRKVALKMLKTRAASDEWIERFRREARLAGLLHHPHFVRLYDYGTVGGGFYYTMEYLDGLTLAQLVERDGPQPPARVAGILRDVCDALAEAHALGLLHRDIKPQNVMLCRVAGQEVETVKVLDFGLVKRMDGEETRDLTTGLRILGTPAYLAPERIEAPASSDPRSDLYAVGALGFYLLTGRKPFEADNDLHLTHLILHTPAPTPGSVAPGNSTSALDALILRCLAKAPADRPPTAQALAREFAAMAENGGGAA